MSLEDRQPGGPDLRPSGVPLAIFGEKLRSSPCTRLVPRGPPLAMRHMNRVGRFGAGPFLHR